MVKFTGLLGTKDSQLGNVQLGIRHSLSKISNNFTGQLGIAKSGAGSFVPGVRFVSAAVNDLQTVTTTVTVSQAITPVIVFGPTNQHLSEAITVTQVIVDVRDTPRAISHSITVAQTITPLLAPFLQVTQEIVEVFYQSNPPARMTQFVIEVFYRKAQTNSVTDTITVTPTITLPNRIANLTVTDTLSVVQTESPRDDHVRKTVSTGITVTPIIGVQGVNHQAVTSTIAVTSTPFGRNNFIRLGVTSNVGVASPTSERDDTSHQTVTSTGTVHDTISGRDSIQRITLISIITTLDTVGFRNTNPRRSITDGIVVATAISNVVPHGFVTSNIAVAQSINERSTVVRLTVQSAVSVTQVTDNRNTNPRITIEDTINVPVFFPNPITARNAIDRVRIADFVSLTETIAANNTHQYVVSSIIVSIDIRKSFKAGAAADNVTVTSIVTGGNSNRKITVADTVTVTSSPTALNAVQRLSFTERVRVTSVAVGQGPRNLQSVSDSIVVIASSESHTVAVQNVHDLLSVNSQIATIGGRVSQTVTSTVTVTPTIRDSPINITVVSTGIVGQRIRQLEITLVQPITVTTKVNKRADLTIHDTLTFVETPSAPKIMTHTISDTIVPVEELDRSLVWNRTLSDLIVFPDQYYIRSTSISPDPIVVPIATGTIVSVKTVVLRSNPSGAIVLSAPLFDDSQANVNGITIRRTMNGGTYSFVKSSDRQKLIWTFKIAQAKAIELRMWITKSISEVIHITDWQGRIWTAKMTVNPPSLSADGRFAPEVEYTNVELQFDAVKLSG